MRAWFRVANALSDGAIIIDAQDVEHVMENQVINPMAVKPLIATAIATRNGNYAVKETAEEVLRLMLRVERQAAMDELSITRDGQ